MNTQNWKTLRKALSDDIATGKLKPGDRLPTEPELAHRYQLGRHSVRRAVAELAKQGRLSLEQGRGTFVAQAPTLTYYIGPRTRLQSGLSAQGVTVRRELLDAEYLAASPEVRAALALPAGAHVIKGHRLTFGNDVPLAFGSIFHDAGRFPDMIERRNIFSSLTETYKSYGIDDYLRGDTKLYSRQATPHEAKTLVQHPDMPVVVVRAVDTTLDGVPLSFAKVVWSAARVTFDIGGA